MTSQAAIQDAITEQYALGCQQYFDWLNITDLPPPPTAPLTSVNIVVFLTILIKPIAVSAKSGLFEKNINNRDVLLTESCITFEGFMVKDCNKFSTQSVYGKLTQCKPDNLHSIAKAGDTYTPSCAAWPSVHQHKHYKTSAHIRNSSAHWLAHCLVARVIMRASGTLAGITSTLFLINAKRDFVIAL
jgi:hypothetical protein